MMIEPDPAIHDAEPPAHAVIAGFRATGTLELLTPAWSLSWKLGSTVLSRVDQPDLAVWTAKLREVLRPVNVGVVRPLRSSDGRYVLGGWRADAWVPGAPAPRFDEIVAASLRLSDALAEVQANGLPYPGAALVDTDPGTPPWSSSALFRIADQAAFADDPAAVMSDGLDTAAFASSTVAHALDTAAHLAGLREDLTTPDQLVSTDMVSCTLFDGAQPPVVTQLTPTFRPAVWPAAVAVVDGVAWGGADDALVDRWCHLPDFEQLLIRAVLYRLFIHALHPFAHVDAMDGLRRVAEIVAARAGEPIDEP